MKRFDEGATYAAVAAKTSDLLAVGEKTDTPCEHKHRDADHNHLGCGTANVVQGDDRNEQQDRSNEYAYDRHNPCYTPFWNIRYVVVSPLELTDKISVVLQGGGMTTKKKTGRYLCTKVVDLSSC